MITPDFDDLTPPDELLLEWVVQSRTPDSIGRYQEDMPLKAAYRAGARHGWEQAQPSPKPREIQRQPGVVSLDVDYIVQAVLAHPDFRRALEQAGEGV
jgi:hypothetical protein